MAEIGEAPFTSEKLTTGKDILKLAVTWHERFKKEKWTDKPSFHDEFHIRAMDKSAQLLLTIRNSHPHFDIDRQLNLLNQLLTEQTPGFAGLEKSDLEEVMQIVAGSHDLGNICEDINITTNGIEPGFLENGYTSKNAESRSQQIAEKIINFSGLDESKKSRYVQAVKYLIGQTEVKLNDPDEPFAVFMRICDQVGANLLSQKDVLQRTAGLRLELLHEYPQIHFAPDTFYNYVHKVLPDLVPGETTQNQILACWGFEGLPKRIPDLSQEKLPLASFAI